MEELEKGKTTGKNESEVAAENDLETPTRTKNKKEKGEKTVKLSMKQRMLATTQTLRVENCAKL